MKHIGNCHICYRPSRPVKTVTLAKGTPRERVATYCDDVRSCLAYWLSFVATKQQALFIQDQVTQVAIP